jgi:Tfp pilus assembly major pilin PilA
MNCKKAYTIVEILIVLAITFILSGLMFKIYENFIRERNSQSMSVKKEMDITALLIPLEKLIASTGFGIPENALNIWASPSPNALSSFANSNATVGIYVNSSGSDEFYFKSLVIPNKLRSGCWWYINKNEIKTTAVNQRGDLCQLNGDKCLFMDYNKNFIGIFTCNDPSLTSGNYTGLLFYLSDNASDYPLKISGRVYLTSLSTDVEKKECAPGSYKLMFQWGNSYQSLFNCVGGFKVRYITKEGNYVSTLSDIKDLYGVHLCLLIQVSGKKSITYSLPLHSACGDFTSKSGWEHYKWRLIEEDIPFRNIE